MPYRRARVLYFLKLIFVIMLCLPIAVICYTLYRSIKEPVKRADQRAKARAATEKMARKTAIQKRKKRRKRPPQE